MNDIHGILDNKHLAVVRLAIRREVDKQVSADIQKNVGRIWEETREQVAARVFNQIKDACKNEKLHIRKTKLEVSKRVQDQVRNQVLDQVVDQVANQVSSQVRNQVWNQVWNQVRYQVENQVRNQVANQVEGG